MFYALTTFHELMNIEHFEHLTKLVVELEILLSKRIKRSDLCVANELLIQFVKGASDLYTENIMKSGMHELLH